MECSNDELRFAKAIEDVAPPPHDILFGLTNSCNHRCIFCQYRRAIPKPTHLSIEKVIDCLKQAYELGVRECGFGLIDEPFMSEILEDCILQAKKIGFEYVWFNTNGALAIKSRMEKLFINGLNSIKFSIGAGIAETYKKIHGKNDFDKVIQNVKDCSVLRKQINPNAKIFVSFAENSMNKSEGVILENLLRDFVDKIYIVKAVNQGGGMYDEVNNGIVYKEEKLWSRYKIINTICPYPFKRINITAHGYLSACCVDMKNELIVADLNKISLAEAWNSEKMQRIRTYLLNNNMPQNVKCYNCINNTNHEILPI
ncbi:MAG: SPASM domain-containing protein [Fibromonadaceae bacterium]|jgi:organic radical activating enzyme|nr:SPASM domain-containing protein [Fibromonadaceae bacterium]